MRSLLVALSALVVAVVVLFGAGWIDVGRTRWPVKTFRDADRSRVRLEPIDTTIAALTELPRPPDSAFRGRSRIAPEELRVYRVRARLKRVLGGTDGDVHLILADPVEPLRILVAEIPSPLLSIGSGWGKVFAAERAEVSRRFRRRGELVEVTGMGFFDYYTGGHAKNGFELHPVIGLEFLNGR